MTNQPETILRLKESGFEPWKSPSDHPVRRHWRDGDNYYNTCTMYKRDHLIIIRYRQHGRGMSMILYKISFCSKGIKKVDESSDVYRILGKANNESKDSRPKFKKFVKTVNEIKIKEMPMPTDSLMRSDATISNRKKIKVASAGKSVSAAIHGVISIIDGGYISKTIEDLSAPKNKALFLVRVIVNGHPREIVTNGDKYWDVVDNRSNPHYTKMYEYSYRIAETNKFSLDKQCQLVVKSVIKSIGDE